jgi:hypothetical protein
MTSVLLSTTYFGPVQWYQKLHRTETCYIEKFDSFIKQTFRNRCIIATSSGTQVLTVPVERTTETPGAMVTMKDVRISDHGNWRHLHWNALCSAYGDSPFFEYYADDLRPFFEQRWERLYDYNMALTQKMCELLDIQPRLLPTEYYQHEIDMPDFREVIRPKHPLADPDFQPHPYYQVFACRHGFQPNLSILDLLFNMGPESVFFL